MVEFATVTKLEDWQQEMRERFPDGQDSVAFVCACCGNIATTAEIVALGGEPDNAATNCIGRYVSADKAPRKPDSDEPCNWAAYGLFGTLGNGRLIEMPDGKQIEVFRFAGEEDD